MFFFDIFVLAIVGVAILIIAATKKSQPSNQEKVNSTSRDYDYGYWEGRRSLRGEVLDLIDSKDVVSSDQIRKVVDANQWYPELTDKAEDHIVSNHAKPFPAAQMAAASTSQTTDYTAGLLYLGAFLFIAAASLFVLLSGVGGGIKTMVIVAVSAAFYSVGLLLSKKARRLAGVGVAFSAIGLMLAPLAGVAAYGYWLGQEHGGLTWLVTSLVCLALYTHALFSLRGDYVGYLCIAMLISLVEAATFQLGLNMYYLVWALMLVAAISAALQHYFRSKNSQELPTKQLALPLQLTSIVTVPVALFWSLFLILDYGLGQFILSLAFAGIYYLAYGYLQDTGVSRQASWLAAQCSILICGALFVYHISQSHPALSVYFAACAAIYFVGSVDRKLKQVYPRHHLGIFNLSTLLILITALSVVIWPQWLLACLVASALAFWVHWRVHKQLASAALALMTGLTLPGVFGWYLLRPILDPEWMAALYTVVSCAVMAGAYYLKGVHQKLRPVLIYGYISAITFALCIAYFAGYSTTALVLACAGLIAYIAARAHKVPDISYIGHAFMYGSLAIAVLNFPDTKAVLLPFGWLVLSLLIYILSFIKPEGRWSLAARVSSSAGLILVAYISLAEGSYWYLSPVSLLLLASICGYESYEKHIYFLRELALATALFATQIFLYKLGLREVLVYSHAWAALAAVFAVSRYRMNYKKQSEDYIWASLFVATIPFAFLIIGGSVGVDYGWLFIAQHICIVMAGVLLRRSNILWWGLLATILAVLYELRDLQFIALGILSVFVLGIAIWLALRRQNDNTNGQL